MSSTHHYKSNLRDLFFNLFEFLQLDKTVFNQGPYASMDESVARETLIAYEKFCSEKMASSFVDSDRIPLRMDEKGDVFLPPSLSDSIKTFYADGWHLLEVPEHLGGTGAPKTIYWAGFEMLAGANPVAMYYLFGTFGGVAMDNLATESQKKLLVKNMLERHWGATMVLTEPDAGSDVGAGRTKARHIKDDLWEIEGVKRFITNGDFDCAENIIHFVLARPENADVGTKGLSLFIVPKFWINEDGTLGERNGVECTNIEKKMGVKGSATSELTFGEKKAARGLLVGNVHNGIKQMFRVIEQARMAVGGKSMSTLSSAYFNALEFAKDRVQGPDLLQALDKHSPRVRIVTHPDVRRMLMMQKCHAEAMRALFLYAAYMQDMEILSADDPEKVKTYSKLSDLLLPLIKGYNSEKCYELLALSLQCFGGSGYLQDYPIEQYIRDQKIDSLYEGTTHIQSLDLIFRKIAKDGAQTLNIFLDEIRDTLGKKSAGSKLDVEYAALQDALEQAEGILMLMMAKMSESLYYAGLHGNRILFGIAELLMGGLMVRQAEVAAAKLENARLEDKAFYTGKLASVRFYCRQVLPGLHLTRRLIEEGTLELMEVPEEALG